MSICLAFSVRRPDPLTHLERSVIVAATFERQGEESYRDLVVSADGEPVPRGWLTKPELRKLGVQMRAALRGLPRRRKP